MSAQIRVRQSQVSDEAAAKYLTSKERKRLRKKGTVTISLPEDRKRQQQARLDLRAVYVS